MVSISYNATNSLHKFDTNIWRRSLTLCETLILLFCFLELAKFIMKSSILCGSVCVITMMNGQNALAVVKFVY